MTFLVLEGDCRARLRELADSSVDAVVTDPPYGLSKEPDAAEVLRHWLAGDDYEHTGAGFMGKTWDSFVPGPVTWREVLRVLKPGGHALVFAGSRTQDLMGMALRLAGFEIRDGLQWIYGSGFPKSHNVGKAIDKAGPPGQAPFAEFARHYEERRKAKGLTHKQICEVGGFYGTVNHGGSSANWANGYGMPTVAQWEILRPLLGLDDRWKERVERVQYEREVLGVKHGTRLAIAPGQENDRGETEILVTAPGSDQAKAWEGWGTALKPAFEPIIVARKPLIGTVAENVLRHGTGALNIDACRIEGRDRTDYGLANATRSKGNTYGEPSSSADFDATKGRWPANVIHDGSDEVEEAFAAFGERQARGGGAKTRSAAAGVCYGEPTGGQEKTVRNDSGSASRFFYCAKASKADRDAGLADLEEKAFVQFQTGNGASGKASSLSEGRSTAYRNIHPTVKPTELMRWLVRLVTPPGGTVLDPFTGSGSTGRGAVLEGFDFLGIELSAEYAEIARKRIAHAAGQEAEPARLPGRNEEVSQVVQKMHTPAPTPPRRRAKTKTTDQGDLFALVAAE